MASYVAAYRIGMLVSGAGAFFWSAASNGSASCTSAAWKRQLPGDGAAGRDRHHYHAGGAGPEKSVAAEHTHRTRVEQCGAPARHDRCWRLQDFFFREGVVVAIIALVFVVLFKFTDALAGVMTEPFAVDLGFTRKRTTPRSSRASASPRR